MSAASNEMILTRAKEYFRAQLNRSLELAFLLPTDPKIDIEREIAGTKLFASELREKLKHQDFSLSVQTDAFALLHPDPHQLNLKPSDAFQLACNAILRAKIENARILAAQLEGRYHEAIPQDPWFSNIAAVELPPVPGDEIKDVAKGLTFGSLTKQFFDFKSKNDWAGKTAADVKRVIALALELIGSDKPVTALGIDDVKRVRDALASVPPNYMKKSSSKGAGIEAAIQGNASGASLSVKTQDKYFTMFRQILIWGENEGHLDKAPGANVKVAGVKKIVPGEQRDPYSTDQLNKIFKSPLYTGHLSEAYRHKIGKVVVRDGYFWIPLIALHSGMRLGEVLQLLRSDVREENGIWYFDVRKGEGKSLKTASSKRKIPIHRQLLDLGFVEFISSKHQAGRIFEEIGKGSDGYHSHHFSKWWGRYSKHVGFKSKRTAFHSFRHNFLDGLRAANSPDYINKALMGHSDSSVHGAYGSGIPLYALKDAVDKIAYPLDFSGLKSSLAGNQGV